MEPAMTNDSKNPNPTDQVKTQTITLKAADGEVFNVDESVAMEFDIVKVFFEDYTDNENESPIVPLLNVKPQHLSVLIEYVQKQLKLRREPASEEESKKLEEEFVKGLSNEDLVEMISAANFLDMKNLLDALCQDAADRIKNKSVEYVRDFLGIENDYTQEEEEAMRAENAWAYEGIDED